jgi:hypothetical protein
MILARDTTYYHESGLVRTFKAGEEAPRSGWQAEPYVGVAQTPEAAPEAPEAAAELPKPQLDHDFDGKAGGSLPKARRKYVRKAR